MTFLFAGSCGQFSEFPERLVSCKFWVLVLDSESGFNYLDLILCAPPWAMLCEPTWKTCEASALGFESRPFANRADSFLVLHQLLVVLILYCPVFNFSLALWSMPSCQHFPVSLFHRPSCLLSYFQLRLSKLHMRWTSENVLWWSLVLRVRSFFFNFLIFYSTGISRATNFSSGIHFVTAKASSSTKLYQFHQIRAGRVW